MVLASQAARPANRRRYMTSSARKRRQPWLLAGAGLTVVIIGIWALTQSGKGPHPEAPPSAQPLATEKSDSSPGSSAKPTSPSNTFVMGSPAPTIPHPLNRSESDRREASPPVGEDRSTAPTENAGRSSSTESSSGSGSPAKEAGTPKNPVENRPASDRVRRGIDLKTTDPLTARRLLSSAVLQESLTDTELTQATQALHAINDLLVFNPTIVPGDEFASQYVVQRGDSLEKIARKLNMNADWRLLVRINRIQDARKLREGQKLKVIADPFHAVVHKDTYRLDLLLGSGDERVVVRSFKVGLGEYNSTPTGLFRVKPRSKLINPSWTNPRTGEFFSADDPKNPIGERWIGLAGIQDSNRNFDGYGIHGTVQPESIGRQMSMGCIRMASDDVELIYEVLSEPSSTIDIRP